MRNKSLCKTNPSCKSDFLRIFYSCPLYKTHELKDNQRLLIILNKKRSVNLCFNLKNFIYLPN